MIIAMDTMGMGANSQAVFFDATTGVLSQSIETNGQRWVGDLDGDDIDELLIHDEQLTTIWALEGEDFVEVAQLPTTVELPSRRRETEPATCDGFAIGDLDGDLVNDIVCVIPFYAGSNQHSVLVPFLHAGGFVFERGDPVVVTTVFPHVNFFDLEGDGSPELLLADVIVDIGPGGSFECSSPHELGFGRIGNLDGDPADEILNWDSELAPNIYDLSW
jgi:hypothetical protein